MSISSKCEQLRSKEQGDKLDSLVKSLVGRVKLRFKVLLKCDGLINKKDFRKTTLFVFSRVKRIIYKKYIGNFPEKVITVHVRISEKKFLKNKEFPRNLQKAFFLKSPLLISPSYDVTIYKIKLVI